MSNSQEDTSLLYKTKVQELLDAGKQQEALSVLENGISICSSDISMLKTYLSIIQNADVEGPLDIRIAGVDRSITLLLGRLAHVPLESVDPIVKMIDEIRETRKNLTELQSTDGNAFDDYYPLWLRVVEGNLPTSLPSEPSELEGLICELETLQESLPDSLVDSSPAQRLDGYLKKAKIAQAFDAVKIDANTQISKSLQSTDHTLVGFSLQEVEMQLRNFAVDPENLDSNRFVELKLLIERLRFASNHLASYMKTMEATTRWQTYCSENQREIDRYTNWYMPPNNGANKCIEMEMNAVRSLIQDHQEVLSSAIGTSIAKVIYDRLNSLGVRMGQMSLEQQRRYDLWAVKQIRAGYEEGSKHAGFWDNEKAIAQALIEHFEEIDLRLLGHEAQNIYSEIFNLLFERLDKPSKKAAKDFETKSNKLYVLEKLMATNKKCLSDF